MKSSSVIVGFFSRSSWVLNEYAARLSFMYGLPGRLIGFAAAAAHGRRWKATVRPPEQASFRNRRRLWSRGREWRMEISRLFVTVGTPTLWSTGPARES